MVSRTFRSSAVIQMLSGMITSSRRITICKGCSDKLSLALLELEMTSGSSFLVFSTSSSRLRDNVTGVHQYAGYRR